MSGNCLEIQSTTDDFDYREELIKEIHKDLTK